MSDVRLVVTGCRALDPARFEEALGVSGLAPRVREVLVGDASGIDLGARAWAQRSGVPVRVFCARWRELGRVAGPLRNRAMMRAAVAAVPEGREVVCLAVFSDASPSGNTGTRNAVWHAQRQGLALSVWAVGVDGVLRLGQLEEREDD